MDEKQTPTLQEQIRQQVGRLFRAANACSGPLTERERRLKDTIYPVAATLDFIAYGLGQQDSPGDCNTSSWRTIPWPVMEQLMEAYQNEEALNLRIDYGRVSSCSRGVIVQWTTDPDGTMPLAAIDEFHHG